MAKIKKFPTQIGLFALIMANISTMIGSGWLFGAWKAARLAGPAAILAWPIGAFAMMLLAFSYAELGSRYPATGGMVRYTQLTHGTFAGFIAGWANWIAIVSVIAIEAVSSIQYLSAWHYSWTQKLYDVAAHQLTTSGLILAAILIVIYFLLNYWSVKLFIRSMVTLTIFKIIVPILTAVMLCFAAIHTQHFDLQHKAFMPYGMSGVLTAVATAGIIFSFHGFQSAINLSGEAKKPKRNVPLAIFISMLVVFVLYLVLQIVFVGTLNITDLQQGWRNLQLNAPYVHLALAFNFNWLVILLYIDAFISPSGTGITYTATTARMLQGIQYNGFMPNFVGKLNPKYHIARGALWINLAVSFLFLYLFRGWSALVAVISVATIISYVNGPVSAMSLHQRLSTQHVPLRIMGLPLIAPLAFIMISLILYWARWPLTGQVILIMLVGLPIYFYYQLKKSAASLSKEIKHGIWLPCYLCTIALISYLGSTTFGGHGYLDTFSSIILIIIVAVFYYTMGLKSKLPYRKLKH